MSDERLGAMQPKRCALAGLRAISTKSNSLALWQELSTCTGLSYPAPGIEVRSLRHIPATTRATNLHARPRLR